MTSVAIAPSQKEVVQKDSEPKKFWRAPCGDCWEAGLPKGKTRVQMLSVILNAIVAVCAMVILGFVISSVKDKYETEQISPSTRMKLDSLSEVEMPTIAVCSFVEPSDTTSQSDCTKGGYHWEVSDGFQCFNINNWEGVETECGEGSGDAGFLDLRGEELSCVLINNNFDVLNGDEKIDREGFVAQGSGYFHQIKLEFALVPHLSGCYGDIDEFIYDDSQGASEDSPTTNMYIGFLDPRHPAVETDFANSLLNLNPLIDNVFSLSTTENRKIESTLLPGQKANKRFYKSSFSTLPALQPNPTTEVRFFATIMFSELKVTVIEEYIAYDLISAISEVGGISGMMFGWKLLSVVVWFKWCTRQE